MVATRGLGCLRPGSIFGHKKTPLHAGLKWLWSDPQGGTSDPALRDYEPASFTVRLKT